MTICPKCSTEFDSGKWKKLFCSRKCANSRSFSHKTNIKRAASNKNARANISDEDLKKIEEKRLLFWKKSISDRKISNNNLSKSRILCKCGKNISIDNKHKMCMQCYRESDIFLEVRAHYNKNYKRMNVVDSNGTNVLLLSSLEIYYYQYLTDNNILWRKPSIIKYIDKFGKTRRYLPDFYLISTNEIIKIKGHWWDKDREKMKLVIEQHPKFNIKILMKNGISLLNPATPTN